MAGRRVTITCDFCHYVNRMERRIEEGEIERVIRCHACEGLLVARFDNLPMEYRPNTAGRRAPR